MRRTALLAPADPYLTTTPGWAMFLFVFRRSIMCSYNAVNGVPSCANSKFQNGVLRERWGWDGFITDCQKDFTHPNTACKNATSAAWKYLPHTWDPYNVLVGTCHENDTPAERGDAEADAFAVRNTPFLAEMRRRNRPTELKRARLPTRGTHPASPRRHTARRG